MTQDGLFAVEEAYDGDPLRPDLETPTPVEIVARLTRTQREQRTRFLMAQARSIIDDALATHLNGRELVATCILFSGGNDSTTVAHQFKDIATHAIHANTTIGIEATRQYVRDTCATWGLQLVEETPPHTYRELVLGEITTKSGDEVWAGGFPGPGAHGISYQRLKERALDKARHTLGIANSRTKCALWIGGRRRDESERREAVPLYESDGSVIWCSPIALWTKLDLNTYRLIAGDVPRNWVTDLIHMSGECLCGAFAKPGELDVLRMHFPEVADEIEALQDDALEKGHVAEAWCTWGHGMHGKASTIRTGYLCASCTPAWLEGSAGTLWEEN